MKHEKKIQPEYFQKILEGKKTYELRLADWECNPGDTLLLREWNPATKDYTGRTLEKIVTYVGKTKDLNFWSEEEVKKYGYQIISFKNPLSLNTSQAFSFLSLAEKYLHTCKNILEQNIESENPYHVSDPENVQALTKWSDFNVFIPTLFLFYHGIELALKGLLLNINKQIQQDHDIVTIYRQVKEIFTERSKIIELLEKYIENCTTTPALLRDLMADNPNIIDVSEFYLFLRYPISKKMQNCYNLSATKYKSGANLQFAKALNTDIESILIEIVKIHSDN